MHVPEKLRQEVFDIATDALATVDENDVPIVVRALLRSCVNGKRSNVEAVLDAIRPELTVLSSHTNAMLAEVLAQVWCNEYLFC